MSRLPFLPALCAATLAAVLLASAASAQTWERIPPPPNYQVPLDTAKGITFLLDHGGAAGSLVMVGNHSLLYDPANSGGSEMGDWVELAGRTTDGGLFSPDSVVATTAGSLIGAPITGNHVERSTDGGRRWVQLGDGGASLLFRTSLPSLVGPDGDGAVFVENRSHINRSLCDGATGTAARRCAS